MSDVLGVDCDGAELRVGDKVKHDFGATGSITGITWCLLQKEEEGEQQE